MRIAVIDKDRCKNGIDCNFICGRLCPINRTGDECIVIKDDKPAISETMCTGCGICPKKCIFKAISIVNLAEELSKDLLHQYGENAFRLFRLPHPRENSVTGLIGENGTGKTTIMRILAGDIVPNLGKTSAKDAVLEYYSGTGLHDYFSSLYKGELKAVYKPQYVDIIPKAFKGKVGELLENAKKNILEKLGLASILERGIAEISGGELQRVAIAACLSKDADVYLLDEPSSYLDVRQRFKVAKLIRDLSKKNMVIVAEHDLIVLDYLADYVNIIYGKAGVYGIVSHPRRVREGINVYLKGYLKEENVKFREEEVRFYVRPPPKGWKGKPLFSFSDLKKTYASFSLDVKAGEVNKGEVIGVLGPNAIGKTTFMKLLAGILNCDEGKIDREISISYKPQYIKPQPAITVKEVLGAQEEVSKILGIELIFDRRLEDLSGGELQRVAIAACLSKDADVYLLDEPSAYLDVEQRLMVAKVIKKTVEKKESMAMVVDHDVLFTDYISDRIIVFRGKPGIRGYASEPMEMRNGMNAFLKEIGITFRRDPETGRPRANKERSKKDKEQKAKGEYYYL